MSVIRFIVLASFVGSSIARAEVSPAAKLNQNVPALSLKDALDLARKQNPVLLKSKEGVNQYDSAINVTRAAIYPTIVGSAEVQKRKDAVAVAGTSTSAGNSYDEYSAGLTLSQPLYQKGLLSAIGSAEKDQKISELGVKITDRDLAANIVQYYYQIVLNMKVYDALVRQQQIVEKSLQVTEHRKQIGRSQLLDVLQAKTQIALIKSQVVDAKNQIDVANLNLSSALGTPNRLYAVQNKMEIPDFESALKSIQAQKNLLPEIEQNTLQTLQIDDQKDVLWGKNLPNLALVGDYAFQNQLAQDLFQDHSNSWYVGALVTIPIFSGFSTNYSDAVLTSQKHQLELNGQNLENQNALQVGTNLKQLENARINVQEGVDALDLAKQSSDEAIRQYKLTTIDFLQFLTIEQQYVQAEQALDNAKYNYIVALTNYCTATSHDMDELANLIESAANK